VPEDINQDPSTKSTPAGGESLKVDKHLSPQAEKTAPDSLKPSSPKGVQGSPGAGGAPTSPTRATPDHNPMGASSVSGPTESAERLPQAPGPMDSGLPVGRSVVRAHPRHSLRRSCNNIHGSQSLYGTIQTLSRPDCTSVGL
jgi:hypothetical protein